MTTLTLLMILYFVPSIVAASRQHPNRAPVSVLNIFLGWTLIGWVVALCWSLTAQTKESAHKQTCGPRLN